MNDRGVERGKMPLEEQLECVTRQVAELEMLTMIDSDGFPALEELRATLEHAMGLLADNTLPPTLGFDFTVATSAPRFVDGAVVEDERATLRARFELPAGYPSRSKPIVRLDGPHMRSEVRTEVLRAVNAALEEAGDDECLQQAIDAARSSYADAMAADAQDAAASEAERLLAAEQCQLDVSSIVAQETVLGRRCVYFHHILGVGKRQCIASWARQFRINGWAKIGYPGILIVEGPECTVAEYIRWLQRLRWKLMVVRGEERIQTSAGGIDEARVIPSHGVIEMIDASDIAGRCRSAGIDELFLTSMKKYR